MHFRLWDLLKNLLSFGVSNAFRGSERRWRQQELIESHLQIFDLDPIRRPTDSVVKLCKWLANLTFQEIFETYRA